MKHEKVKKLIRYFGATIELDRWLAKGWIRVSYQNAETVIYQHNTDDSILYQLQYLLVQAGKKQVVGELRTILEID